MQPTLRRKLEPVISIFIICVSLAVLLVIFRAAFLKMKPEDYKYVTAAEEHVNIGINLYKTGSMTLYGYVNTGRPVGYPVIVALILHLRDFTLNFLNFGSLPVLGKAFTEMLQDDFTTVMLANIFFGGLACLFFYLIIKDYIRPWIAWCILASVILNPCFLAMIMRYDYSMLELAIIFYLAFLYQRFTMKRNKLWLIIIGVSLGIACLIRPVYLLFPAFFVAAEWILHKQHIRSSMAHAVIITLIALIAMTPNIIRNYNLTGRFILVSKQGSVEVFHNSVVPFWQYPQYTEFGNIWRDFGWPLVKNALNLNEYSPSLSYTNSDTVFDIYWKASYKNITEHPAILTANILYNIKQISEYRLDYWGKKFFKQNHKYEAGFHSYHRYLSFLLASGSIAFLLTVFLLQKKELSKTLFFTTALVVISYSLVYYYPRYNYIKIPIYFLSFALVFNWLWNSHKLPWLMKPMTILAMISLLVISVIPLYYFYIYL
jgi:hypothetical protein